MNVYLAKAQFLLGYIDLRFNRTYQDRDKNSEINLWAGELSSFKEDDLDDLNMKKAVDFYVSISSKKCFAPTIDEFCEALRKTIYKEPLKLNYAEPDWIDLFNKADNVGKYNFFITHRNTSPITRWYAKTWFTENTKFNDNQIINIVNGRLSK